ncbi:hypothetical protein JRI60_35815 [Archangium violaceum]|uniref:hypothetical protein n=1 Tax=Archangium violaceum TaxID=83451 RepID=UPI00194E251B|nr:hypothetical protein [Archangium violaceum]QRN94467.1 hypothetical protein JRI60_35815 [Archangium violaceum]
MRILGTLVVGLFTLLGSPALADLPVINEAQTSRNGCNYRVKVLEDSEPHPSQPILVPLYRVVVESEIVSPATCLLTPGSVELGTSYLVPKIAIAANDEGLAVAYSWGAWVRFYGDLTHVRVHRLDPSTLASTRTSSLEGGFVPPGGGGGGPGSVDLDSLTLYPGFIMVMGTLSGNSISDLSASPYESTQGTGSHFVAIYPDFFNTTQRPIFDIYY